MAHPIVRNRTPFAYESLFINDEHGRPVLTPIVKATFSIGAAGSLALLDEQPPVDFEGEYHGEPGESSLRREPEVAFDKPSTDVVLLGHAWAPRGRATEMIVELRAGPLVRSVRVTGDRHWEKGLIGARMTPPRPFEKMPLVWERAYGGSDLTAAKEKHHGWEPRNPVGVGFHHKKSVLEEGSPLPNLEDPSAPLKGFADESRPAGFGFLCPNWEPRLKLAGTYDGRWQRERAPLLASDFSRRHFNAAPSDLIAPKHFTGDEAIGIHGATPEGRLDFQLPGLQPPSCSVRLHQRSEETVDTRLDTVIVDTDAMSLTLIWRTTMPLPRGPLDVAWLEVRCANAPRASVAQ